MAKIILKIPMSKKHEIAALGLRQAQRYGYFDGIYPNRIIAKKVAYTIINHQFIASSNRREARTMIKII